MPKEFLVYGQIETLELPGST